MKVVDLKAENIQFIKGYIEDFGAYNFILNGKGREEIISEQRLLDILKNASSIIIGKINYIEEELDIEIDNELFLLSVA